MGHHRGSNPRLERRHREPGDDTTNDQARPRRTPTTVSIRQSEEKSLKKEVTTQKGRAAIFSKDFNFINFKSHSKINSSYETRQMDNN